MNFTTRITSYSLIVLLNFFLFSANHPGSTSDNNSIVVHNFTAIKIYTVPKIEDNASMLKQLIIYNSTDNTKLININTFTPNRTIFYPYKINIQKSADGIYLTPKIFQDIYKFLTGGVNKDTLEIREDQDYIRTVKFNKLPEQFHLIIRREYRDSNFNLIFRSVYLDQLEYKYILTRASEILQLCGL